MPDSEKVIMWNGGTTNETKEKAIRDWNKMIRESEDYIDTLDIEKEFNPRDNINKNMNEPAKISGGEPRNRYRRPEGDKIGNE
tara:strand:+ start:346 stop:594 length:249 start_codon:yes stop_codon:yes gene_type:complete